MATQSSTSRAAPGATHDDASAGQQDRGLLPYIAAFKILKAGLLIVVGLAAFQLVSAATVRHVEHWLAHLTSPAGRELVQSGLGRALGMGPKKLETLGVGAWLYAALYIVEGIGLWRQRRWAEYLTIVATASFIPFELYELAEDASAAKVSALVLNVAVVAYLIVRVRRTRRRSPASRAGAAHPAVT